MDIKKVVFILMVVCSIFPLFNDLDKSPIGMWDEANYANNSIDMLQHPNLIVVSTEGIPETYNTKPPLVICLQALSYKVFGINEFALRLPSAIMGLCTIVLILWFCFYVLNTIYIGVIATLIIITSKGFIATHVTRTGDLDATLTFFTTFYCLLFFNYLLSKKNKTITIALISSGIICAVLTKGMAGLFLLPFLILLSFIFGFWRSIVFDKRWYIAAASVIAIICGYYFLRETMQPGYLQVVYQEEFSRYYTNNYAWLNAPFNYYIVNMIDGKFFPYIYLVPFVPITFFLNKQVIEKKILVFSILVFVGYLLFISFSNAKLAWYDAIIYPYLSLSLAIFIHSIVHYLFLNNTIIASKIKHTLYITLILLLFIYPFNEIMKETSYSGDTDSMYEMIKEGAYMRILKTAHPEIKTYTVLKKVSNKMEHYDQLKFYQRSYNLMHGYTIQVTDSFHFNSTEPILTCQEPFIERIEKSNCFIAMDSCIGCKLYYAR